MKRSLKGVGSIFHHTKLLIINIRHKLAIPGVGILIREKYEVGLPKTTEILHRESALISLSKLSDPCPFIRVSGAYNRMLQILPERSLQTTTEKSMERRHMRSRDVFCKDKLKYIICTHIITCAQSNVIRLIPIPCRYPNIWFTGILSGAIQQTQLK